MSFLNRIPFLAFVGLLAKLVTGEPSYPVAIAFVASSALLVFFKDDDIVPISIQASTDEITANRLSKLEEDVAVAKSQVSTISLAHGLKQLKK